MAVLQMCTSVFANYYCMYNFSFVILLINCITSKCMRSLLCFDKGLFFTDVHKCWITLNNDSTWKFIILQIWWKKSPCMARTWRLTQFYHIPRWVILYHAGRNTRADDSRYSWTWESYSTSSRLVEIRWILLIYFI